MVYANILFCLVYHFKLFIIIYIIIDLKFFGSPFGLAILSLKKIIPNYRSVILRNIEIFNKNGSQKDLLAK